MGEGRGFDPKRLAAALKAAGVVAPHVDSAAVLAADAALRLDVVCCCLLALGDEYVGADLAPLRRGGASERARVAAEVLTALGLVPNEQGERGGFREGSVDGAAALLAGDLRTTDAGMKVFDELVGLVEVRLYTDGLGVSLDEEYRRCRAVETAALRSLVLQSAGGSLLPSGVTAGEKARARERIAQAPASAAAAREQQASLQAEIDALEREAAASETAFPAIPPPHALHSKLTQLNAAVSRLIASGDALAERMHMLGLPADGVASAGPVHSLTDAADAVHAQNHRLAALPDTAAQLQTAFAALASTAEQVATTFDGEQAAPDISWAKDYALV